MTENTIVMHDSPEAAQHRTGLSGWVSRRGHFFGDGQQAEELARYDGCTHVACRDCGAPTPKTWTACESCRSKAEAARYAAMPRKVWDGEAMLYSQTRNEYFSDIDSAEDALEEGETLSDLRIVICEPNYARRLDDDLFCDELPEDGEVPDFLRDAIDAFNAAIGKAPPLSWSPGKWALDVAELTASAEDQGTA